MAQTGHSGHAAQSTAAGQPAQPAGQPGDAEASAAEIAAARALAIEGVKLAQAGQCKDALDKLERAEKLRHSAIVLGHLAECQITLGRWVEGSENLRKLLREPMPPDASPALQQAYQRANTSLREIKPRIPTVTVIVKAPKGAELSLKLDGRDVPDTMIGVPVPADPGDHVVDVEAPGFFKATASVHLEPGAKETTTLELRRDPFATALPQRPNPAPLPAQANGNARQSVDTSHLDDERDSDSTRALAYVSYGLGAVGLALGIGFGRAAMQDEADLDKRCPGKVCPPDVQGDLDAAKTKGLLSTIGFGVGAAGLTLGTVLLISSSGSHSTEHDRTAFRPRARVGLGSVEVGAEF